MANGAEAALYVHTTHSILAIFIELRRYSSYYQRTYNGVGEQQHRTPYTSLGAGALKSKSRRGFVLPLGSIVLICFWLTSCGGGSSHSSSSVSTAVHVSPSTAIVATSTTQQFTVTGITNTTVNWSVNGTAGGNSTVGTISASGLYTAPSSIPNPATVQVTAADQASPSLTGSASGTILDLGTNQDPAPPAATLATAAMGMAVAKSGRSSGLTCSSVQTINTSVRIDYQTSCNGGTTFTVTFNNQVVVNGGSFSAAGDSGSLIVDSQTAQPVALLYGGNSTGTGWNSLQALLTDFERPLAGAPPGVVGGPA